MIPYLANLEDSSLNQWLNSLLWGFPCAEVFHIVMTGGFFGAVLLMDLRLLGLHRLFSLDALMKRLVPYIGLLFAGVLISGCLLLLFMPAEYAGNPALQLKFVLILIGGLNALLMHKILLRNYAVWPEALPMPIAVKLGAGFSLLVWMGCLACGRMVAYFYSYGF